MATAQLIDLGYRPREQFRPFHMRRQRWACMVAHRRAGKTVACIMDLIDDALRCTKQDGRYAYIAPFYAQAKDVAWSYLKRYTAPIPGVVTNEGELRVDLPSGARIRLYGADNYDRMRGLYLDGAVLDEAGDMDPRAWPEVIRPALSDRKGWAVFIGTPKGKNGFYEIMYGSDEDGEQRWPGAVHSNDWFASTLKASETQIVDAEELADARRMMTAEQYEQEYECSFDAAVVGAYYGRDIAQLERNKQITSVPWEPSVPVITSWDLGIHDNTSIWFAQLVGREIRIIDHYSISGQSLADTARVVLREKPYLYGEHLLPHDVKVRELSTGKSRQETLEGLGLRPIRTGTAQDVAEGINAVRLMLPKCWFDAAKCKRGLESLKHYRREFDEKRKTFRNVPLHDWASHDADAFKELAQQLRPLAQAQPRKPVKIGTVA